MTDHFWKNSQRLKVLQKSSITDVWLDSKYASVPYMTYLSKICVSTKKMVAGLAHKNI